jgi:NADH:ubiquinone reductase (H+-translocating)
VSSDKNTHVVIVGGGFAGVSCAHKLAGTSGLHITLIDKNNYHQFQPLLYQVATAELGPSDVAFMLRKTLKEHPNVEVKMEEVTSVDAKTLTVTTAKGSTYRGDFLVLAAGPQPNFFSTPGTDKNTFPLYALKQAERLRSRILAVVEAADRDPALIDKGALNFVIVGGGPSGTEMAGALAEMVAGALTAEFKDLAMQRVQVFLIDHGPGLLAAFSQKGQAYASKTLRERGVQLRFGVRVEEVGPDHVLLSDGSKILTHTVIWAGGLKASPLSSHLGLEVGRGIALTCYPNFQCEAVRGSTLWELSQIS